MSEKLKEPIQRRRSSPDCDTASSTKSSLKGVKKSSSFVASDSRQPLHEEIKFANDHDDLFSGMLPTEGANKSDSLRRHSSINLTQEESINSAIRSILQPLKSPHVMSLDQINNTVSYIHETVDAAVNDVLTTVTVHVQQSPIGTKDTGLEVKADYTVKFIDEENSCSAVSNHCSLSLTPTSDIAIGIKRSESVESSAPHSATSQRSSISPYPGSSNTDKAPGSKDDLVSHMHSTSIPSQKSIQPLEGSSTITDNIGTNDTKVNYICLYHAYIYSLYLYSLLCSLYLAT